MKAGQKVRLLVEFAGVPAGTMGEITGLEAGGKLYSVRWLVPGRDPAKPVVHLFTPEECQKYLEEV